MNAFWSYRDLDSILRFAPDASLGVPAGQLAEYALWIEDPANNWESDEGCSFGCWINKLRNKRGDEDAEIHLLIDDGTDWHSPIYRVEIDRKRQRVYLLIDSLCPLGKGGRREAI